MKATCLIIPKSDYLSLSMLKTARRIADEGAKVIFVDGFPKNATDDVFADISEYIKPSKNLFELNKAEVVPYMQSMQMWDIKTEGDAHFLRYYHYSHKENELYMFTNEGIRSDIDVELSIKGFDGGDYAVYDVMENKIFKDYSENGKIKLHIAPYNSVVYVFGDLSGVEDKIEYKQISQIKLDEDYCVLTALQTEYPAFKPYKHITKLVNVAG